MEVLPPPPYDTMFSCRGPQVDSNEQLVAYRGRNRLAGDRVTYTWFVVHRNEVFAYIVKRDSKWVHDNWSYNYTESNGILTRQNRLRLDATLDLLIFKIRDAIRANSAETVALPYKE